MTPSARGLREGRFYRYSSSVAAFWLLARGPRDSEDTKNNDHIGLAASAGLVLECRWRRDMIAILGVWRLFGSSRGLLPGGPAIARTRRIAIILALRPLRGSFWSVAGGANLSLFFEYGGFLAPREGSSQEAPR